MHMEANNKKKQSEEEIVEDLLKGRLKIIQPKRGYRFSIDALLLANFTLVKKRANVADLGTGSGVVPLVLSFLHPGASITGVEIDAETADRARRSVALNNLAEKIDIVCGDVRSVETLLSPGSFDTVVANPPYGKIETGRINPEGKTAAARHELAGGLDDFIKAAACLLKPKGRFSLVYPARRLSDAMAEMRKGGVEPKRLRMVHSREGAAAKLVLLEGVKGGGVEMEVMAPLVIYESDGRYTKEIEAMYG